MRRERGGSRRDEPIDCVVSASQREWRDRSDLASAARHRWHERLASGWDRWTARRREERASVPRRERDFTFVTGARCEDRSGASASHRGGCRRPEAFDPRAPLVGAPRLPRRALRDRVSARRAALTPYVARDGAASRAGRAGIHTLCSGSAGEGVASVPPAGRGGSPESDGARAAASRVGAGVCARRARRWSDRARREGLSRGGISIRGRRACGAGGPGSPGGSPSGRGRASRRGCPRACAPLDRSSTRCA